MTGTSGHSEAAWPDSRQREVRFQRLKPSPNGLAREYVERHQRLRLCGAMIDLVADHGYEAITIRQLSKVACVSTRDVYQCLGGKEQCFLHAYDAIVMRAERRIRSAHSAEREWQSALRQALAAFAIEIAERPKAARLALVESFSAGPVVLERADCVTSRLEALLATVFEHAQALDGMEVPPLIVKAIVAGMLRVARARLLRGDESQMPELVDVLWTWALDYRCANAARLFAPSHPAAPANAATGDGSWWHPGGDRDADHRMQLMTAAARLAAQNGCAVPPLRSVLSEAILPSRTFHTHFQSVEECILAALENQTLAALAQAASAGRGSSWAENVQCAIRALVGQLASDPVLAQLAFVEVSLGPAGVMIKERLMAAAVRMLLAGAPAGLCSEPASSEASVGAVWGLMQHCIVLDKTSCLQQLPDVLSFLLLAPVIGAPAALSSIGI